LVFLALLALLVLN